ncbi:CHRD domain-containing protein [Plantactinospora sp. S1510]|uniref:CHRD domain-containing protein n=1 Tax=Plantactinospora alkalitolerans TaxID=2789879 RepID=A0ABS0GVA4_9ACTN|nr:CHRD domain-containing protein [Plantactinospora alkalitolerans]MBF9129938.1 CHRD domain-containing protein [Plantactinospora alkalitolerans]
MMIGRWRGLAVTLIAVLAAAAGTARLAYGHAERQGEDDDDRRWSVQRERLTGYQETPLALSTTGTGRFAVAIDEQAQEIEYQLSYDALEGDVTQAHIHFGVRAQSGGISAFLCTNLGNGPAGTQPCPADPATVTGTIRPADVIGPVAQGIAAGQFGELLAALRVGAAYVNVHSSLYPGGEIRTQLGRRHYH